MIEPKLLPLGGEPGRVAGTRGDAEAVLAKADRVIEAEGFRIDRRVPSLDTTGGLAAMVRTTAQGMMGLAAAFEALAPDVVVTIADRYETMATAVAASYMNLPLAHGSGDAELRAALSVALARVRKFAPAGIVVALGLDASEHDPLGVLKVTTNGFAEAARAVAECREAGIVPVMITGDHPDTAHAVAERVGVAEPHHDGRDVITSRDLADLDDDALAARVLDARVYARVDPAQKIRIVQALQARGQVAAMTGDGVNDAPALRQADIGVAMGRGGTDVARGASAMILLDAIVRYQRSLKVKSAIASREN